MSSRTPKRHSADGCQELSPPRHDHRLDYSEKPSRPDGSSAPIASFASSASSKIETFPDTVGRSSSDAKHYFTVHTRNDMLQTKEKLRNTGHKAAQPGAVAVPGDSERGSVASSLVSNRFDMTSNNNQSEQHSPTILNEKEEISRTRQKRHVAKRHGVINNTIMNDIQDDERIKSTVVSFEDMEARSQRLRERYGWSPSTALVGMMANTPSTRPISYNNSRDDTTDKNHRPINLVQHIQGPNLERLDEGAENGNDSTDDDEVDRDESEDIGNGINDVPIAAEVAPSEDILRQLVQDIEAQAEERAIHRMFQEAPVADVVDSKKYPDDNQEKDAIDTRRGDTPLPFFRRRVFFLMIIGILAVIGLVIALIFVLKDDSPSPTEPPTTPPPRTSCYPDCGLEDAFPAVASLSFSLENCNLEDSWTMVLCSGGVFDGCEGLKKIASFSLDNGTCNEEITKLSIDGALIDNSEFRNIFLAVMDYPFDSEDTCYGSYEIDFEESLNVDRLGGTYTNGTLLCNNGDIIAYLAIRDDLPETKTYYVYYSTNTTNNTDKSTPNYDVNQRTSFSALANYFMNETGEYCMDLFSLMPRLFVDLGSSSPPISPDKLSCGVSDEPSYVYYPAMAGIHFSLSHCSLHHSWLMGLCHDGVSVGCSYLANLTHFEDGDKSCTDAFFGLSAASQDNWYPNTYFDSSYLTLSKDEETCNGTYGLSFTQDLDDASYTGTLFNGRLLCNNGDIIAYLGQTDKSGDKYYLYYATKTVNDTVNKMNNYDNLLFYLDRKDDGEYCLNFFHLMSKLLVDLKSSSLNPMETQSCGRRALGQNRGFPAVAGFHFAVNNDCVLRKSWHMLLCPFGRNDECDGLKHYVEYADENKECMKGADYFYYTKHDGQTEEGFYPNSVFKSTSLSTTKSGGKCDGNYKWEFKNSFDDYNGTFTDGKLLCNDGDIIAYLSKVNDVVDTDYYIYYSTNTVNDDVNTRTSYNYLHTYFETVTGRYCLQLYSLFDLLLRDVQDYSTNFNDFSCGIIENTDEPTKTLEPTS